MSLVRGGVSNLLRLLRLRNSHPLGLRMAVFARRLTIIDCILYHGRIELHTGFHPRSHLRHRIYSTTAADGWLRVPRPVQQSYGRRGRCILLMQPTQVRLQVADLVLRDPRDELAVIFLVSM